MPKMNRTLSPTRPSLRVLMIGMPPPTLASKLMSTPFSKARAEELFPGLGQERLVAVTTCFSASMAWRIIFWAASMPAHRLHDDIDIGILQDIGVVGGQDILRNRHAPIPREIDIRTFETTTSRPTR